MKTKKNTHGGKRDGAGRPKKYDLEKTITISFRVHEFAATTIKNYLNSLSIHERTKFFLNSDLAFFDDINNEFETGHDLKSIKEYVNEVFLDGVGRGEMHPDFNGFDIYKKIGYCTTEKTGEIRNDEPVWKVVYCV